MLEFRFEPAPWMWRDFGSGYELFTAHSGAKSILGGHNANALVMPNPKTGILELLTPDHPHALMLQAAPELFNELLECYLTILATPKKDGQSDGVQNTVNGMRDTLALAVGTPSEEFQLICEVEAMDRLVRAETKQPK